MATFQSGPINPPTSPSAAFHAHVSKAVYKFRGGQLSLEAFIRLQHDMPLPITVLRELWRGDSAGPKTQHLVTMIWNRLEGKPVTIESIAHLVTHLKADPSNRATRDRVALLGAVLDALEGTEVSRPNNAPALTLVKRIGLKDGRHQAFWCVVSKGSA